MDYYVIHEYSSNESERGTGNPLFDDRCVSRIRLSLHRCEPYEEGFIYRAGRIFTMDLALFLTFLRGVFLLGEFSTRSIYGYMPGCSDLSLGRLLAV